MEAKQFQTSIPLKNGNKECSIPRFKETCLVRIPFVTESVDISCIMITRQIGIRKNHSGSVSSCIIIMLKRFRSFNWSQLPATCNEFNQVPVLNPQDLDFSYLTRKPGQTSSFCAASSAKQMAQISPVSAQVGASTRRISPEKSQGMEHPNP